MTCFASCNIKGHTNTDRESCVSITTETFPTWNQGFQLKAFLFRTFCPQKKPGSPNCDNEIQTKWLILYSVSKYVFFRSLTVLRFSLGGAAHTHTHTQRITHRLFSLRPHTHWFTVSVRDVTLKRVLWDKLYGFCSKTQSITWERGGGGDKSVRERGGVRRTVMKAER